MSNGFDTFADLPEELQLEALREGEKRIDAQLLVAKASDARALSWSSLLVAAVTACLAGAITLGSKGTPDYLIAIILVVAALALLRSASLAVKSVEPIKFSLPGNEPEAWLPEHWACTGSAERMIAQARIDQAEQMTQSILKNRENARIRAELVQDSFKVASSTIGLSAVGLFIILIVRAIFPSAI